VRHADVRAAIARLAGTDAWPLSAAELATTEGEGEAEHTPRIVLREHGATYALTDRGWQRVALSGPLRDIRLRLRPVGTR
jgi:hypothetical protein